jgi:hypothetical protein
MIEWPSDWADLLFVTLTYPGEQAPEFQPREGWVVKRHFKALCLRFQREFGVPLQATWKLEFQRRGVPHLHLAMVPPGCCKMQIDEMKYGLDVFRKWLAEAWFEIVGSGSEDHRRAGTSAEFFKSRSPQWYFTGYTASDKGHQHEVPIEFSHPGRWWGVVGLKRQVGSAEVTREQAVKLNRTMRKYRRRRSIESALGKVNGVREAARFHKPGTPKGRKALRQRRLEREAQRREDLWEAHRDPVAYREKQAIRKAARVRVRGVTICGGQFSYDLIYQISRVLGESFAQGFTRFLCRQVEDGRQRFRFGMFVFRGQVETGWVS